MKGLPFFPTPSSFAGDPQLLALARRLNEPLADSYWQRLRGYCFQQEQDRIPADVAASLIEHAVRWTGRRGRLMKAMLDVGLLERDGDDIVVVGVNTELDRALVAREHSATRQRIHRERIKEKAVTSGSDAVVMRDVRRESQGRVENSTEQKTREEQDNNVQQGVAGSACPPVSGMLDEDSALVHEFNERLANETGRRLFPIVGKERRDNGEEPEAVRVLAAEIRRIEIDWAVKTCVEVSNNCSDTIHVLDFFRATLLETPGRDNTSRKATWTVRRRTLL